MSVTGRQKVEAALSSTGAVEIPAVICNDRLIMSIGSPVTPGTSVERVRLYCDLAHELGSDR